MTFNNPPFYRLKSSIIKASVYLQNHSDTESGGWTQNGKILLVALLDEGNLVFPIYWHPQTLTVAVPSL